MKAIHAVAQSGRVGDTSDSPLIEACKRSGFRVTRARLAVYGSLVHRQDHPDVERLFDDIRLAIPSLSLNTVYRTIHAFESAGLVVCVASCKGMARFDGNVQPHAHFLCECCGTIADVDGDDFLKLDRARLQALQDRYGAVSRADLLFSGTCAGCLMREAQSALGAEPRPNEHGGG